MSARAASALSASTISRGQRARVGPARLGEGHGGVGLVIAEARVRRRADRRVEIGRAAVRAARPARGGGWLGVGRRWSAWRE